MTRRKSLARRWPIVLYRVEQHGNDVVLKAWEANAQGRMFKSRPVGSAVIRDWEDEPVRDRWVTSDDTDGIHELPLDVREGLWEFDDAIREAYKRKVFDWEPVRDSR